MTASERLDNMTDEEVFSLAFEHLYDDVLELHVEWCEDHHDEYLECLDELKAPTKSMRASFISFVADTIDPDKVIEIIEEQEGPQEP